MTSIAILHEAEIELWEAVEFYENRCAGLGLDLEREIKAAVEGIQQSPARWPIYKDGTRRCLIHRFPYFVVYALHQDQVWIVAFAHCRRRPGYWSGRANAVAPRRQRRRE
ncbi:MAG TPA: type II toxin-antitoxin system RelE/ParE family toxin [Sedimentisphaerales bacterium]|nr:type II toxin-antitoxin system RelE/ParE family toxin [Sedimentisphaerales bacterium]